MSETTKAIAFNAVPLALLSLVYAILAVSVLTTLRRDPARAHPLERAAALVYPGIAISAAIFSGLVFAEQRPIGGRVWLSLAAILIPLVPALAVLVRGRGRMPMGGIGVVIAAQRQSVTIRNELEAVARVSTALTRAGTFSDVVRPLVKEATGLLHVGFAGIVIVDESQTRAQGAYGELDGEPATWWAELDIDLQGEPSGIASAVFDRAPVTVFDVASSPLVNPRLSALSGAKSGAWIPMAADDKVIGVLAVASTDEKRAFAADEMALLTALAAEGGLALARLRSGEALSEALAENERRVAEASTEHARQGRIQLGFSKVASLLGEPVSLAESYAAAAAAAADVLGAESAALLAPAGDGLVVVGSHILPEAIRALGPPRVVVETSSSHDLLAAPQLKDDARFEEAWRDAGLGSLLAIPVPGEGGIVLLALFAEPRAFGRDDVALAEQLAQAARGVLDRSRLFEAERASRSLSQRLGRAGSRLLEELDPAAVVAAVVTEAAALVDADAASLTQVSGGQLVIAAAAGAGAAAADGRAGPGVDWPAGDVVSSGQPLAYEDVPRGTADPLLEYGHRAYFGVPVPGPEGVAAAVLSVYAQRPRVWRNEEREALVALAANAGVALSNAELYRRVAVEREQGVAILSNIADGIVAVDQEGRVVLWNRAAEAITGVPAVEAIGRLPAQVLQRELETEDGALSGRLAIRRGADEVWLSLTEAVMRDPSGAVAGRIFAFRDVSSEHAMEAMRSEFVSAVSLDLRAPLTSIYGFARTLLREDVAFSESDRLRFLEFIAREAEHLTVTVDSLLGVGRAPEPLQAHEEVGVAPRTEEVG